jgi:hypothetical protein
MFQNHHKLAGPLKGGGLSPQSGDCGGQPPIYRFGGHPPEFPQPHSPTPTLLRCILSLRIRLRLRLSSLWHPASLFSRLKYPTCPRQAL